MFLVFAAKDADADAATPTTTTTNHLITPR
jgi:hypothetical protein